MTKVVNIAAYRFAPLRDLKPLRERLLHHSRERGLRGTILLSPEGINLFVAGAADGIDVLLELLRAIPGLDDLSPKFSESDRQPFRRMLVRIKREIIAFGVPGIDPARRTSPKLAPRELRRWLDEGRPVTLLDTRNDYEVKLGTFRNAVTLGLDHFRNFPSAVSRLPDELKNQPIVMFCTGGIRCEKAGPYMEHVGFRNVHQLDGGILKYFEECGGEHYSGECFVFDQRVGLDPALSETENTQCFSCLTPLTTEDQASPRYRPGESCPYCFLTTDEQMVRRIAEREAAIRLIAESKFGTQPYENVRPFNIPLEYDGRTLLEALTGVFDHVASDDWTTLFDQQRFIDSHRQPVPPDRVVRAGERYERRMPETVEPEVDLSIRILHEDEAIIVVDKPAPLPVHPSGRFHRNTLRNVLNQVYAPQKVRPVHRLDANTTGVLLLARTRHHAGRIQPQFADGRVEKRYLARVQGHPPEDSFACDAPISDTAGEFGGRVVDEAGLSARTEFEVLKRFADGTTLLSVRPVTGRTNQIRIHLWHLGWPICGERSYLPGRQLGTVQTHECNAPPLCLHASEITFVHPLTHTAATFKSAAPSWSQDE